MADNSKLRLLREKWRTATDLSEELFAIWPQIPDAGTSSLPPTPAISPGRQLALNIQGGNTSIGGMNFGNGSSNSISNLVNFLDSQGIPVSTDSNGQAIIPGSSGGEITIGGSTFNLGSIDGLVVPGSTGTGPQGVPGEPGQPGSTGIDTSGEIPGVNVPTPSGMNVPPIDLSIEGGTTIPAGDSVQTPIPVTGNGSQRRMELYALPNAMPGQIVSGSGHDYIVKIYDRGLPYQTQNVSVTLLPPDQDAGDLDVDAWVTVIVNGGIYTMMSSVWT